MVLCHLTYASWSDMLAMLKWHFPNSYKYSLSRRAFSNMDSNLMDISINYHYLLQLLLFILFIALHYTISKIWQHHLLVANRTFFCLSHKNQLLFHPFSLNRIFLSLFVFELFIFKVRPDFWITRYICAKYIKASLTKQ